MHLPTTWARQAAIPTTCAQRSNLIEEKKVQAAKVVTHILGLNAAGETTLELPAVGGGKKLVYTGKYLPLTSLTQIQDQALAAILARHQGIWSGEAEQYLLAHAEAISHD